MKQKNILILSLLIIFTILTRMVHIDGLYQFNAFFSTVIVLGMFSQNTKTAIAISLGMMLVSDLIFETYDLGMVLFNYAAVAFSVFVSARFKEYNAKNVLTLSLIVPTIYYLFSNLGVWIMTPMYTRDFAGFIQCYDMAIPFYKGSVLGTLAYSSLYLVIYHYMLKSNLIPIKVKK